MTGIDSCLVASLLVNVNVWPFAIFIVRGLASEIVLVAMMMVICTVALPTCKIEIEWRAIINFCPDRR